MKLIPGPNKSTFILVSVIILSVYLLTLSLHLEEAIKIMKPHQEESPLVTLHITEITEEVSLLIQIKMGR